jgi:hypothetical protein
MNENWSHSETIDFVIDSSHHMVELFLFFNFMVEQTYGFKKYVCWVCFDLFVSVLVPCLDEIVCFKKIKNMFAGKN